MAHVNPSTLAARLRSERALERSQPETADRRLTKLIMRSHDGLARRLDQLERRLRDLERGSR